MKKSLILLILLLLIFALVAPGIVILILSVMLFTPEEQSSTERFISPNNLSEVRVAVQYRYVTDGVVINRSVDDVIKIFKELKADFVFQGWITQKPCPDKCSDLPQEEAERFKLFGYSYEHLRMAVSKIKSEMPNVIFCGGVQAEFLFPEETGKSHLILEPEDRDKAWKMALDPKKWGINVNKKDFQCFWAKRWGYVDSDETCPDEEELKQRMKKYFPDLTNPNFQKIFLKRIYKQIDAGVDAIWIDMLYMQAHLMEMLTKDPNHPAVKESYEAAWKIVEKIHEYGRKKGKYIYVITWVAVKQGDSIVDVPKEYVNVDAAMVSPSPDEIKDKLTGEIGNFNEELWDKLVNRIREKYGIPIFARIDYGGPGRTPLYVFSQELSKEEAREFLRRADKFFSEKGIIFIYPVHGGDMGRKDLVKKLSYGKFNWYDSLAPEFQTFETIKELAQNKRAKKSDLSKVKVAILYERITDGIYYPSKLRAYEDLVKILNETNPDLVFRVWWRWTPIEETLPSTNPVYQAGYTYQQLEETLTKLKKDFQAPFSLEQFQPKE